MRGIHKLTEEAGEVAQICAKIAAFPETDTHPDGGGSLRQHLSDEVADVMDACRHVIVANDLDERAILDRMNRKLGLFAQWGTI